MRYWVLVLVLSLPLSAQADWETIKGKFKMKADALLALTGKRPVMKFADVVNPLWQITMRDGSEYLLRDCEVYNKSFRCSEVDLDYSEVASWTWLDEAGNNLLDR